LPDARAAGTLIASRLADTRIPASIKSGPAMNLNWIKDFRTLAETRSFSLAARQRNITQSAFSKRIRSLEAELGGELVQRKCHPLTLTPLGEQFLTDSTSILVSLENAERNAERILGLSRYVITFTAATSLSQSFFPAWITAKKAMLPQLIPQMTSSKKLSDEKIALLKGEVDLLLTYAAPGEPSSLDSDAFDYRVLGTEVIMPVCAPSPQGRPLFDIDNPPAAPIPYLSRLMGSYIGALVEARLQTSGLRMVPAYAGANGENIIGLLLHGNGMSWMPQDRVRPELERGRLVPAGAAHWNIPVQVRLYRRKSRDRQIVERFWDSISSGKDEFPFGQQTPTPRNLSGNDEGPARGTAGATPKRMNARQEAKFLHEFKS